jgi:hypothetical protein
MAVLAGIKPITYEFSSVQWWQVKIVAILEHRDAANEFQPRASAEQVRKRMLEP